MSSLAWESALSLLGTGTQIWTMRRTLEQERKLHAHEHRTAMEQHFSSMSTELLAIAKEADRDVWEQRQNMFSQLLVCAVLMFGVAFGNINEGTYAYDKVVDKHGFELRAVSTVQDDLIRPNLMRQPLLGVRGPKQYPHALPLPAW